MSTVDLSPALKELTNLYSNLLAKIKTENNNLRGNYEKHLNALPDTVISIAPRDRRVEDGWYRPAKWDSHTNQGLAIMDQTGIAKPLDEIFISGEAFNLDQPQLPMEITKLMLHQIAHQLSHQFWGAASSAYHEPTFGEIYKQLGFDVERDKKHGWMKVEYSPDRQGFLGSLTEVAEAIVLEEFDAWRKPTVAAKGPGRMRLWKCECDKAPAVYTGSLIFAVCERCQSPLLYSHKDRTNPQVVHDLIRRGLSPDRIRV
jgi:hypothetical protein